MMAAAIQERLMRQFVKPVQVSSRGSRVTTTKIKAKVNSRRTGQRIGLEPSLENLKLTETEWKCAKEQSNERRDSHAPCVICKQNFGLEQQNCLRAFERFTGKLCCPLCRRDGYETRVIFEASKFHRSDAAIRIQKWWRRYVVMKWYKELRRTVAPKDPTMRKRFFEDKLTEITNKIITTTETEDIDSFFEEINRNITESKEVLAKWQFQYDAKQCNWTEVQLKTIDREINECPICLSVFDDTALTGGDDSCSRPVSMTSCGHLFHTSCIFAFEQYTNNKMNKCPACRSEYERKELRDIK